METSLKGLDTTAYVSERLKPRLRDNLYLHLSDLLLILQRLLGGRNLGKVLDFGAGGSPYKQLIVCNEYLRADIPGDPTLDYVISPHNSRTELPDDAVDFVLSTQVAEHVGPIQNYFAEAYRVLKPGGEFFCSTHGMFEEHGCPHDYWRWTADGLRRSLTEAGFEVREVFKLTCGLRGLLFNLERCLRAPNTWWSVPVFVARGALWLFRCPLHWLMDVTVPSARVGRGEENWYVNLAVLCRKP